MAIKNKGEEQIDWNVDMEVQLFYAMRGHKPVGVNRHFQMACIHEKFRNSIQKDISSQQIWDHLDTMYDMAELHASEIIPFPNEETEFLLPMADFGDFFKKDSDKKEDDKPSKSRESSGDEKDSGHYSAKQSFRDRQKEGRDGDATDAPKRKRGIRHAHHDSGSKPGSPAASQSGAQSGKRRRIQ